MTNIKQFGAMFEALVGKSLDDTIEKTLKGESIFGNIMEEEPEKQTDFLGNEIDEES